MKISTKRIEKPDDGFLLQWASFFSTREGTAFFHTGRLSQYDHSSLLFLCPEEKRVSWDYTTMEETVSAYPSYGVLSYEVGSPYRSKTVPKDPLYALFSPTIWATITHDENTLSICFKEHQYDVILNFFNSSQSLLQSFLEGKCPPDGISNRGRRMRTEIVSWENRDSFCDKVSQVRTWIHAGDVYQLNLTYEVLIASSDTPFAIFQRLIGKNPSPQSAFLRVNEWYAIISSSPERLLSRKCNRLLSQPIKGTRPRGKTAQEDGRLLQELMTSQKERAELAMIIDLVRNDLFQISVPGTISIENPFAIEAYESVFQQYANIISEAKQAISPLQALLALSPGGSVTGCPKKRALQRIHELEDRMRGPYTGSIGYILSDDRYDWNIVIRTLLLDQKEGTIRFSVGSGIVWDSDPISEYEETLHKAKSLVGAIDEPIQ